MIQFWTSYMNFHNCELATGCIKMSIYRGSFELKNICLRAKLSANFMVVLFCSHGIKTLIWGSGISFVIFWITENTIPTNLKQYARHCYIGLLARTIVNIPNAAYFTTSSGAQSHVSFFKSMKELITSKLFQSLTRCITISEQPYSLFCVYFY